ncbi:MAG: hypothetical protein DRH33_08895 [Candidatus Nealsonbacteria bacterium]|nr:MAG: hypothetical protein DRH33_08895 [Candidatus Nealsonbacteria bacterium]
MGGYRMNYDFSNQVVLITGAGRGIGEAVSRAFAKTGAKLVLVDIDEEAIKELKNELISTLQEEDVLIIKTDVSGPKDVSKMTEKAIDYFGRIDILFNNAGINKRIPLKDVSFEDWRKIMSVNLDGMFLVAQAVGKEMIKRKKGKIINTASMSGFIVNENLNDGVYCTSKAAIVMLTKALAVEWVEYNIDVNAIAPGYTKTPLIKKLIKDSKIHEELKRRTPAHRLAEPDEIARAVLYLSSPLTTYITGHTLKIEGGYTIW